MILWIKNLSRAQMGDSSALQCIYWDHFMVWWMGNSRDSKITLPRSPLPRPGCLDVLVPPRSIC